MRHHPLGVHTALPSHAAPEPWHRDAVDRFRKWVTRGEGRYAVVDDPATADLIVYFELTQPQTVDYVEGVLTEPLRRRHANKLVTFNQHWKPMGFLPGLYTGLSIDRVEPSTHRAWGFPFLANGLVREERPDDAPPTLLYSFRGARSHPVRDVILETPVPPGVPARLRHVDRWFDHTEEERVEYVEELRASRFVVCPRGYGPSSHRLFETMAVGRCPVIVSDAWAPIAGVDWEGCSVRVAEQDAPEIPRILLEREADAEALGIEARRVWRDTFSPEAGVSALLDACFELVRDRDAEWGSREFDRRLLAPHRVRCITDLSGAETERRLTRRIDLLHGRDTG